MTPIKKVIQNELETVYEVLPRIVLRPSLPELFRAEALWDPGVVALDLRLILSLPDRSTSYGTIETSISYSFLLSSAKSVRDL
jgi:hypothetical protein